MTPPKVRAPLGVYSASRRPDGGLLILSTYQGSEAGTVDARADLSALLPDGNPDPAFPPSQRILGPLADGERPGLSRVSLWPDGRVQALTTTQGKKASLRVVRWLADGRVDHSFTPATLSLPVPLPAPEEVVLADLDAVTLTDGGAIVGVFLQDTSQSSAPKRHRRILLRVNAQGVIDPSFGSAGMVLIDSGDFAGLKADDNPYVIRVAIQADGKVLLGHSLPRGGATVIAVARYDPTGRPDPGFAAAGGHESLIALAGAEALSDMLLLPDQSLLVSGTSKGRGLLLRLLGDRSVSPAQSRTVVEFYNNRLAHYFLAIEPTEIAAIEAGTAGPGWSRTGSSFQAFLPESGIASQARPVCRFYGTPGVGPNSHFYTAHAGECEFVKSVPGWSFEGIAFYIETPIDGQCATGTTPVFRSYNNGYARNDSNHRYTPEPMIYGQMQAQGWVGEGVAFCGAP